MAILVHRRIPTLLAALALLAVPAALAGQAIIGTVGGSSQAVVFPSPNTGLPTPTQNIVPGLPAGKTPHGVAYYGSDNALVSDFGQSRIFVIQISTASLVSTITTSPSYNGTGTIVVSPGLNFALGMGSSSTLSVIAAPFQAGATITTVTMPGSIQGYQTQAIVFNAAGRAFVYHSTGISVLDPPYNSIAFTIPAANSSTGAIAITPDGNKLLVTNLQNNVVRIFTAPYSASSLPENLTITGGGGLDGIMATPDGTKVLVISSTVSGLWAISAPYSATSTVEAITAVGAVYGTHEDVGISADSQLAILAGNGSSNANTAFVRAPFTTAGATVFNVQIPGGRGNGAVRFLPPGLAPGLTISKSAPSPVSSGQNLTYTITYGNTGGAAANNVVIRDPVPAGTTFVSATGGGTESGGVVTWNIGTVNAGVTGQTVSFTVNVTQASGQISNVNYTIEGTGIAAIPGPPVFTQVGAGGPTATPTPTVPVATATPTATPTVPAPPANVPTLSFPMLALLGAALGMTAILLLRRT